jgi:hypothetical protein
MAFLGCNGCTGIDSNASQLAQPMPMPIDPSPSPGSSRTLDATLNSIVNYFPLRFSRQCNLSLYSLPLMFTSNERRASKLELSFFLQKD